MPVEGGTFGAKLKALRLGAGLTQRDLAERSGISINSISELERGVWRVPRRDSVDLLSGALGLDTQGRQAFLRLVEAERPPRTAGPLDTGETGARRLFGRDAELAALLELCGPLGPNAITLLGPGGVGKTALALTVAARLAQAGAPVVWVELRAVSEPGGVLPALARALEVAEGSGEPLAERIARQLRADPKLLVLDNIEHLLGASADLAAVLAAAPTSRFLATSREAIRLPGERVMRLEPLRLPQSEDGTEALAGNPAVALFNARAEEIGVPLGTADLVAVARVVRLLDGVPLGIELAAAQAGELTPSALADLLELAGLRALDAGHPDRLDRFGTMEQALRWSYRLLDPSAQRLLRWLGVFRGGFAPSEVAAVVGADATALPRLIRASLVRDVTLPEEPTRFSLLEPVRLFAKQVLDEDPAEAAEARERHLTVYRDLALRETKVLLGPRIEAALPILERERANIESALERAIERQPADAARLVADLAWWWELRAEVAHGTRWLERVSAVDRDASPEVRMEIRRMAAVFATFREDATASRAWSAEMIAIGEASGDPGLVGAARLERGVAKLVGEHNAPAAVGILDEAVALLEPTGRRRTLMYAYARRGIARLWSGDQERARADFEKAVALQVREGMALAGPSLRLQLAWSLEGKDAEAAKSHLAIAVRDAMRVGQVLTVLMALPSVASALVADGGPVARRTAGLALGALRAECDLRGVEMDIPLEQQAAACLERLAAAGMDVDELVAEGRTLPFAEVVERALQALGV